MLDVLVNKFKRLIFFFLLNPVFQRKYFTIIIIVISIIFTDILWYKMQISTNETGYNLSCEHLF